MKLSNQLCFNYLPAGRKDQDKGFSRWWLGRIDKRDQKLPTNRQLEHLFNEANPKLQSMEVKSRKRNHCIIFLPVDLKKNKRKEFLSAVEKKSIEDQLIN